MRENLGGGHSKFHHGLGVDAQDQHARQADIDGGLQGPGNRDRGTICRLGDVELLDHHQVVIHGNHDIDQPNDQ